MRLSQNSQTEAARDTDLCEDETQDGVSSSRVQPGPNQARRVCPVAEGKSGRWLTDKANTRAVAPPQNSTEVFTTAEVASYLRIHRSTVYRLLKLNRLPAFRVGSDWRFKAEEIQRLLLAIDGAELTERPVGKLAREPEYRRASKRRRRRKSSLPDPLC